MKFKRYIRFCISVIIVGSCIKKPEILDEICSPNIVTGDTTLVIDTLEITGMLSCSGDGIQELGHLWSTAANNPTLQNFDKKLPQSTSNQGKEFKSRITFEVGITYFIRSYAIDVHNREFYGRVIPFKKDPRPELVACFSDDKEDEDCPAPCTVTFDASCSENGESYTWSFRKSDNSSFEPLGSGPNPLFTYTFLDSGTYFIRLVISANGQESTPQTQSLVVKDFVKFTKEVENYEMANKVIPIQGGDILVSGLISSTQKNIFVSRRNSRGEKYNEGFEKSYVQNRPADPSTVIPFGSNLILLGFSENVARGRKELLAIAISPIDGNQLGSTKNFGTARKDLVIHNGLIYDSNILAVGSFEDQDTENTDIYYHEIKSDLSTGIQENIPIANDEIAYDAIYLGDDEFMFVGSSDEPSGIRGLIVIRNIRSKDQSVKKIGSSGANIIYDIKKIPNQNSFLICGTLTKNGRQNVLLKEIDNEGNELNDFSFDPEGNGSAFDMVINEDKTVVLVGNLGTDALIVKYNLDTKNILKSVSIDKGVFDVFRSISKAEDDGYIISGQLNNIASFIKSDMNLNLE